MVPCGSPIVSSSSLDSAAQLDLFEVVQLMRTIIKAPGLGHSPPRSKNGKHAQCPVVVQAPLESCHFTRHQPTAPVASGLAQAGMAASTKSGSWPTLASLVLARFLRWRKTGNEFPSSLHETRLLSRVS
jgi:hypothetical protein